MLTDTKVKNLKPSDKRYRVADVDGLYIDVPPVGKKHWLFRYTQDGKRKWISLGEFPMISLREARELRDQKRRALFDGVPLTELVCTTDEEKIRTFEDVAHEWHEKNIHKWTEDHDFPIRRLELHMFPAIGTLDIKTIKTKDLLRVVQHLEEDRHIDTARRVVQICSRVFRYAMSREYCENDPAYALSGSMIEAKVKHYASLTNPREVALLLRNIDSYPHPIVRCAMQFSVLVFLRPGEIRRAEWTEIDIDKKEMRVPAEKMKKRERPHIVPLARQTLELLETLRLHAGHGRYLFPNGRALIKGDRPMSENAVLVALRSMGYGKDQMTAHGFRSLASTLLNEKGYPPDWIERQLAHVEGNSVRAAYNYAEYLTERRRMMQEWADYLDELRGKV